MYLFMHLDFIYLPLEFVYLFLYLNLWNCISQLYISMVFQWFFPLFHFRDEVFFSTVGVFHSISCVFYNLFIIDDNTCFL